MTDMNLEEIATLAEGYAKKYNAQAIAPFPYEKVIEDRQDLDIHYVDLEDETVSGVTFFKDGRFTILINTSKLEPWQHFTLAHELGHYFLHQEHLKHEEGFVDGGEWLDGPNMLYRVYGEKARLELEANNFAGSLIMPAELVRQAWAVTNGSVEDCAQIFKVSTVAMSVRLTRLGLVN